MEHANAQANAMTELFMKPPEENELRTGSTHHEPQHFSAGPEYGNLKLQSIDSLYRCEKKEIGLKKRCRSMDLNECRQGWLTLRVFDPGLIRQSVIRIA